MGTFGSVERTIVWDEVGDCWRDKVTGVDVKGMGRPLHTATGVGFYDAPSQPNDELEARLRGIARDEVAHFLAANTVPDRPMYFIGEHWLVTYGWLADELRAISDRFQRLDRSIVQLRRSWWQRLLDRMFGGDGLGWQ